MGLQLLHSQGSRPGDAQAHLFLSTLRAPSSLQGVSNSNAMALKLCRQGPRCIEMQVVMLTRFIFKTREAKKHWLTNNIGILVRPGSNAVHLSAQRPHCSWTATTLLQTLSFQKLPWVSFSPLPDGKLPWGREFIFVSLTEPNHSLFRGCSSSVS